jgi:putative oxidoreductase
MIKLLTLWNTIISHLTNAGSWISTLPLRLILAWEFWEAGILKFNGNNWFGDVQENFPFPFSIISTDISWFMATWFEILGGLGLALGLFTRFWSISLIVLTIVAILGVHWPSEWNNLSELLQGYSISNNGFGNYKLPLLYIIMFIPLLFQGAGKASVDYWLSSYFKSKYTAKNI